MTKAGLKLRIGGDPNNPKHWENCTVGFNCKRHVHLERIKDTDFDASQFTCDEDENSSNWDSDETLTINGIITRLLNIKTNTTPIVLQFKDAFYPPESLASYRGYYEELCITPNTDVNAKEVTVTEFVKKLNNILGKELTGWKGGEFTMSPSTSVWVDNQGESNSQAAVDVQLADGVAVILTKTVNEI